MRWITFIFLLYLAAGLQAGSLLGIPHAGNIAATWPRIEYVLLLVVFYSLFADDQQAPLVGLVAGLVLDLTSPFDVLGTYTVAMGLVALAIVWVRLSIFREHAASQIVITFLAVLVFAMIAGVLRALGPGLPDTGIVSRFFGYLGDMTLDAIYTGLVAPVAFWLLFRLRPVLGFEKHGARSR